MSNTVGNVYGRGLCGLPWLWTEDVHSLWREHSLTGRAMRRAETRFQSGRLRYFTADAGSALSELEFSERMVEVLSRVRGRKRGGDDAVLWLAAATAAKVWRAGTRGVVSTEYEAVVLFAQRTRVSRSSKRLHLGSAGWGVSIQAIPVHGGARKEFFRDELERWSEAHWCSRGCFGTGFKAVGVNHDQYRVAVHGGFRAVAEKEAGCNSTPTGKSHTEALRCVSKEVLREAANLCELKRLYAAVEELCIAGSVQMA